MLHMSYHLKVPVTFLTLTCFPLFSSTEILNDRTRTLIGPLPLPTVLTALPHCAHSAVQLSLHLTQVLSIPFLRVTLVFSLFIVTTTRMDAPNVLGALNSSVDLSLVERQKTNGISSL